MSPTSRRWSRCFPRDTTSRVRIPRRSAVESPGQRRSAPMIVSSARASLSRRAARQTVSPSGIGKPRRSGTPRGHQEGVRHETRAERIHHRALPEAPAARPVAPDGAKPHRRPGCVACVGHDVTLPPTGTATRHAAKPVQGTANGCMFPAIPAPSGRADSRSRSEHLAAGALLRGDRAKCGRSVVAAVPVAEGPADAAEAVSSGAPTIVTGGSSMRNLPLPGGSSGAQRPDPDDGDAVGLHAAVPGTGDDGQGCRWATPDRVDAGRELEK